MNDGGQILYCNLCNPLAPDAEVTITEKTVSVKKEKVTIVGEQETRIVESSPTFNQTLMPVTEANEGDNVTYVMMLVNHYYTYPNVTFDMLIVML
jgi:hypothetical protein